MNQVEIGKQIARLRKKAGYTQISLAEALLITDKAVSKWERGICLPDSSLLPKLAGLLDTDIGTLIPDTHRKSDWKGLLILNKGETDASTLINGRPLLHYLLSYFLLLEITDITIQTDDDAIKGMDLSHYGFNVSYRQASGSKTMVVYGKTLLFGAYLSKQLLNMMAAEENIIPVIDGIKVPVLFAHGTFDSIEEARKTAKYRSLYRGMVNLPLDTHENVKDAECFVRIYEKYHGNKFCNLSEIAYCRGISERKI